MKFDASANKDQFIELQQEISHKSNCDDTYLATYFSKLETASSKTSVLVSDVPESHADLIQQLKMNATYVDVLKTCAAAVLETSANKPLPVKEAMNLRTTPSS